MIDYTMCKDCLSVCNCCEFNGIKCSICKPFSSMFKAKNKNRCNTFTKYLPGDRVVVRPNLESRKYSMSNGVDSVVAAGTMFDFAGKIVTINSVESCSFIDHKPKMYRVKECGGYWTDEMFVGVAYEHD